MTSCRSSTDVGLSWCILQLPNFPNTFQFSINVITFQFSEFYWVLKAPFHTPSNHTWVIGTDLLPASCAGLQWTETMHSVWSPSRCGDSLILGCKVRWVKRQWRCWKAFLWLRGLSWAMPADHRLWSLGYECSMASLNLLRSVLAQNLRPGIVTGLRWPWNTMICCSLAL